MQDFDKGKVLGEEVTITKKRWKNIQAIYRNNICDLSELEVMYEVYTVLQGNPENIGSLNCWLTILYPKTINGECNMTRGHFHSNRSCAEIYFCLQGEGLLLLMDETGNTWAEKMKKGSVHYIDGHLAHRCINTGDIPLHIGACWSPAAGHDYEAIEKRPFSFRIFKKKDGIEYIPSF